MTTAPADQPQQPQTAQPVWPAAAAFAVLSFLYLWLCVNPSLIYHSLWLTVKHPTTFPVFRTGPAFLEPFLAYPGGPVEYAGAYLCQLYYYPWAGAAIATAAAMVLAAATRVWIGGALGVRTRVLHFAPAMALLFMYGRYFEPLRMGLAVAIALAGASLYGSLRLSPQWKRAAAFLALSPIVYYAAGGAFLLFALLCGAAEAIRRRWAPALVCVLGALLVPLAGGAAFVLRSTDAYLRLLPFHRCAHRHAVAWSVCLYLAAPAALLAAWLWPWVRSRAGLARAGRTPAARMLAVLAPVLVGAAVLLAGVDGVRRDRFQVEYYAQHRMWDDLLETARRIPLEHYSLPLSWDINRALYHTGRLGSEMLTYPQAPGAIMPCAEPFFDLGISDPNLMKLSEALLDVGRVNEAELTAYEALEFAGDQPHILRHLALISAAKGQTAAARVLLGALGRDPIHGRWARGQLDLLDVDPLFSSHAEAQRLRSVMPKEDAAHWIRPEQMLLQSLEDNPRNRMAFEYLMAHYLLARRPDKIVEHAGRLEALGYEQVPRHYQEAMLIHSSVTGGRAGQDDPHVGAETRDRFMRFHEAWARHRGDPEAVASVLSRDFGDTYFCFFYSELGG